MKLTVNLLVSPSVEKSWKSVLEMFKRVRFSFDTLHSLEVTKIIKIFSISCLLPSLAPTLLLACTKPLAPANILIL